MATYTPLVGVKRDATEREWVPIMYEPTVLFKGTGPVAAKEKGLSADHVPVVSQGNEGADTRTMQSTASQWFLRGPAKNQRLTMHSAWQHFTEPTIYGGGDCLASFHFAEGGAIVWVEGFFFGGGGYLDV
mmetsp:Transcript_11124/g.19976  ORF Transcript_11124/g.19976 Transcript_11124/m.19976 type:complete len:130 (+) Transcript_11124:303-692(+)